MMAYLSQILPNLGIASMITLSNILEKMKDILVIGMMRRIAKLILK